MTTFKLCVYFFVFCLLILSLAGGFVLYAASQFYLPLGDGEAQIFKIAKGEGVKEISWALENQKLIKSAFWFETYVWLEKKQNKLQAGQYSISPKMSVAQIVDLMTRGEIARNDIWVTVPEGFTSSQIESRMVGAGLASAKNIASQTIDNFKNDYEFLADLPSGTNLQGFLFPDTYKFAKEDSQDIIIIKMLDNFDQKITAQMRQDIKNQGRSLYEIINLASILEKEVTNSADRKIVAGIFWKRLSDKYPLQSDATLSYILGDNKTRHNLEETKIDSPYNTYKYVGLPPMPINNPGLDAITAAIYPQPSDYYFFLTKPDTGEAVFAKTLDEQNQNIAKYLSH